MPNTARSDLVMMNRNQQRSEAGMTKDEFNQDYDRITKTAPVEDMMRQQKKVNVVVY